MRAKSTFSNSTSKSYAVALYELAKENSELSNTEDGMNGLKNLLNDNFDFKEIISNPAVGKEKKKKIMFEIADQYNFSQTLKNFLGFITIKNRLFFLDQIIDSFLNIISINKGELKAKLVSSKHLSKKELENIQSELSKDFKSPIKIDYKYDPNLIAGLIIQVGSVMVDTSIQNKLKQLEKNMVEA
jgi:F-type H+-transporting ATPase subunit delta